MLQINMTPEDIDRFVKDAILKSGVGKAIEETVQKALTSGYNSPIDAAVQQIVRQMIVEILSEEPYRSQVREAVIATISSRLKDTTLASIADGIVKKIERAAEERY